jgi:DNA polymerase elongation subunit (family B)
MELNFIPLDYDYFDWQGRNYVKVIGRDAAGKRICIIDDFQAYFWAIFKPKVSEKKVEKIMRKIEKIKIKLPSRTTSVLKTEIHNKNFLGKEVRAIKIFISNYKDAHPVADKIDFKEIEARREYDIPLITRYIIDKKVKPLCWYKVEGEVLNNSEEFGGIDSVLDVDICLRVNQMTETTGKQFSPKILGYDIEVDELEIGKGEIFMVSLVGENFKKVLTWKKGTKKQSYVETFDDEAGMLEAFVRYVKQLAPDMLVGYFSDGFDLPYLRARAEKNKIKLPLGLDNSQPRFSRGRILTGKIFGIIHIDLLRFIQTSYAQYLHSETLSLNEVASELLGEKKLEFNAYENARLGEPDWDDFFKYNLQDSKLTYKLADKLWPDLLELTKTVQEPLFNISRSGLSGLVEGFILHNLEKYNEIAEKKPIHEEISARRARESVEGAFVFQPKPGLYNNLAVFDFTSMHTSIMVSFNISKATLLPQKEKNSYETPEITFGDKKTKFYFSKKPSFLAFLLKEIFDKRKKFKQEYKQNPNPITKARSDVFKLLSASVHGYQGFFGARYYSLEGAASVLSFVRKFNQEVIEKANKAGYGVIYGDTDSIAFTLNKHTQKQTIDFLSKLNSELPGIMELDLEDFYERGIWVTKRSGDFGAKKKYALINKKGKIKIRGFETIRRDWCQLSRDLQNKVLRAILTEGNNKTALAIVKQTINKIKNREIRKEDILIKTQLKKPLEEYKAVTPHVVAARKIKEQGLPIDTGMLIEYYIAETKPGEKKTLVREKVKLPNEKGKYNIKYYLERQILPAVENILEVFNINTKEVIEGKKQMKLGEF